MRSKKNLYWKKLRVSECPRQYRQFLKGWLWVKWSPCSRGGKGRRMPRGDRREQAASVPVVVTSTCPATGFRPSAEHRGQGHSRFSRLVSSCTKIALSPVPCGAFWFTSADKGRGKKLTTALWCFLLLNTWRTELEVVALRILFLTVTVNPAVGWAN